MAIVIEYRRELKRGEKKFRIIKISALGYYQLPERYTKIGPAVWEEDGALMMKLNNSYCTNNRLNPKDLMSEKQFQSAIKAVKMAGNRLMEINKGLAIENKNWEGPGTITI